ncbi:PaaI family thioesterase [Alkalilacustris brevis]|uniref:PaaI family thioesterase n=1 Tax=Alkalilacustris brevis TaxID=2026338 RepID=UPI001EE3FE87|nr:PaaI family thioesterase [Alkalilacustris brevis]
MTDTTPGWRKLSAGGFMDHIGPLEARRDAEGWRYALDTGPAHANPVGMIHGGVIAGLLDHAIALAAWEAAERVPAVTVQLDTRYLGAAKPGDRLEATTRLRHRTGSLLFLDATLSTGGRYVAAATAVMKLAKQNGGRDG